MFGNLLISICILLIISAVITIKRDLRVLKENDLHHIIRYSRFLHLADKLFNNYFQWQRVRKPLFIFLAAMPIIAAGAAFFIRYALPVVKPAPDIVIDHKDSSLIKRGKYLAGSVAMCIDCHSPRNIQFFSWPVITEQKGAGAPFLSKKQGAPIFPGESFAPNITPEGIGDWTDGELYRLLTTGIDKQGNTINHVMPFDRFSKADPEDLKAIIAYIRTLKPLQKKEIGNTRVEFLHDLYNRTLSRKVAPVYLKDLKNAIDSGRYLVNIASCSDCHTPKKWVEVDNHALDFSGGVQFPLPTGGFVHSANLTPDDSGLGNWSEETFVNKFKSFNNNDATYKIEHNSLNTLMPWSSYVNMTDRDLKSIYAYLRTLKPVYNPVIKFTKTSR